MTMRILFVEPPRGYWFVMGEYLPPPFVLLVLAAYIEQHLAEVEIDVIDCQADQLNWDKLKKYIQSTNPSIVLSSGFTANAYSCVRTCEIAKSVNENIITIVGGIHFSFTADESLSLFPEIDFIIRGEGEKTLLELIQSIQKAKKIDHIVGLSYKHKNKTIHTNNRPLIEKLDSLPYPAYHLVEKNLKKYHFSMMAGRNTQYMILEGARGCNHHCNFCTQWRHWNAQWRTKSVKRIADEIQFLNENYGGVFLWFTDDNINLGLRGKQLYKELKKRSCKEDIMLFLQARTDDVITYADIVENLRNVGTYWIMCGVENNSQQTLHSYNKNINVSDAYKAMKILKQSDIFSHAMFVIGARHDTHESIQQLRQYSQDIDPDFAIYTALTPFPGTSFFEIAKKNGWIEDTNYSHYDMAHAIMPTEQLSRKQVQQELWLCYKSFYGSITKNISGVFSKNKLKRILYRHMAGQFVLEKLRRLV